MRVPLTAFILYRSVCIGVMKFVFGFRTFRLDRIRSLVLLPTQFPDLPDRRLKDNIAHAGGET